MPSRSRGLARSGGLARYGGLTASRGLAVAWAALVAGTLTLVAMVVLMTPWHPLPGARLAPAVVTDYFTPAQIARSNAFFADIRWPSWFGLALGLAVVVALGLSTLGRSLVGIVRRRVHRWWLQVICLVVLVSLVQRVVTLPAAAWAQGVAHAYGLSTQSWLSWGLDVATSFLVTVVMTAVSLLFLVGLARRFTRTWFLPAAAGAGALVIVASFAYPVVIEPLYNSFTPLPDSPLRSQLLKLADRDGVQVSEVLVADASRRTTALNAYVSGFGSTKRIVLYDTLL
ncbi:MAG: M48 family metalloprotease, partial [Propionibacteriales bacterium]|nr:M48 family metalloprotease [Propionibacteriales bacterium]